MLIKAGDLKSSDVHGLRVTEYGPAAEGASSLAVVEVPPNARHPWVQSSRCDTLHLALEGTVQFNVGGVLHQPEKGDLVVVPRGTLFRFANWSQGPARVLVVHLPARDPRAERVLPDLLRTHDVHLAGQRVSLRPMTEDDWDTLIPWNSDPEVLIWSDGISQPRPPEDIKGIYRGVSRFAYVFVIEFESEPIGECWLQKMNLPAFIERFPGRDLRRIDIMIGRKDLWGQGLGSDAIRALVAFAFEREGADGIFALADTKNLRSRRAFQKAGFRDLEGEAGPERPMVIWRAQFRRGP